MNILIRFEDRYGCKTLFSYSQSCLVKCDIVASLGIISGLSKSNYNKLFYKILTLNNLEELNDLVLEKNLESIYKNLDNYNLEITNKSLELCNLF